MPVDILKLTPAGLELYAAIAAGARRWVRGDESDPRGTGHLVLNYEGLADGQKPDGVWLDDADTIGARFSPIRDAYDAMHLLVTLRGRVQVGDDKCMAVLRSPLDGSEHRSPPVMHGPDKKRTDHQAARVAITLAAAAIGAAMVENAHEVDAELSR